MTTFVILDPEGSHTVYVCIYIVQNILDNIDYQSFVVGGIMRWEIWDASG
jgi:hypothetical protein